MTNLAEAREALAEEWERLNPQTESEIAAFYRDTNNYVADLNAWHDDAGRQFWSTIICGAAQACGAKRILDVGAGAGHDLAALKASNSSLTLEAIEPNIEMARTLRKNGVLTFESFGHVGLRDFNKYDMVTCIDVLEHLPNPEAQVLEPMLKVLRPGVGGVFIEATATHDTGTPLHLSALRGWSPARWLDEHGFIIQEEFEEGRLRIWRRVAEKRGTEPNLLLCAYRSLSAETVSAIIELTEAGWRRSIHRGDALVSRVRSLAVSKWYQEDAGDVFLMVDDDIVFRLADAEKVIELARRTKGIASAAYPVRGGTHLASRLFESTDVTFGPALEPIEIQWAGTGFFAMHRDVVAALIAETPLCTMGPTWFWPIFAPFVYERPDGSGINDYLSEDWACCERARRLGFKVWLDRTIELTHLGQAPFTIRTMGSAQLLAGAPTDGGI